MKRALLVACSLTWLAPLLATDGCGPGLEPPAPTAAAPMKDREPERTSRGEDDDLRQGGTAGTTAATGPTGDAPDAARPAQDEDAGAEAEFDAGVEAAPDAG